MKSLKMLAVILLAGIVVASALVFAAQADPGKVKLKISCTAPDTLIIDNLAPVFQVTSGLAVGVCTVNGMAVAVGTPFALAAESDLDIDVESTVATSVTLVLIDGTMNDKYKVKGDGNSALIVLYIDNTGDDNLDVKGDGNDALNIDDDNFFTGAGSDDYRGKDISFFFFLDSSTPDMDKIHIY